MIQEGFRRLGIVFGVVLAVVWLIGSSWMIWETSSRDYRKEKIAEQRQALIEKREQLPVEPLTAEERQRLEDALKNKKGPYEEYLEAVTEKDRQRAKEIRRRLTASRNLTEEPTPNVLVVIWQYKWRFLSIPVVATVLFWIPSGLFWVVGWVFAGFKS